ncbi:hypothetical protein F0562_018601 [Nyssa sinensis]|uniref:Uncharacterized protein n=1 Tax=Nyssa sinensis TaxID=561372 RepID=A0A5J4ZE69_9ASTE|nr:hypothetical protein F0562_018601 [Nyssa sinensis]
MVVATKPLEKEMEDEDEDSSEDCVLAACCDDYRIGEFGHELHKLIFHCFLVLVDYSILQLLKSTKFKDRSGFHMGAAKAMFWLLIVKCGMGFSEQ